MDKNLDEEIFNRQKEYILDNMNINRAELNKERINHYNKTRKDRIYQGLFSNEKKCSAKYNTYNQSDYDLNISNLNIDKELKDENYMRAILYEDNFDKIMEYINSKNNDYLKYGLYLLKEKFNLNLIQNTNLLNTYDFNEIFLSLLMNSKNESNKLTFEPIILKSIYDIIINYININNNKDNSFLCNENYIELHLYFLNNISDANVIRNILKCIHFVVVKTEDKLICKLFEYKGEIFFNELIEIINDYQNNNEILDIILKLFIEYIKIFDNIKKIKYEKANEIEMQDNTYYYNKNIFEKIYDISLILIFNKHFDNSLLLISSILKIIYHSKNVELAEKIINDENNILMLNFLLEKDYSNCTNNIIYMSNIIKYIIKLGFKINSPAIKRIIYEVDKNMGENYNLLKIFVNLLINKDIKLKDTIKIKLIEAIFVIINHEIYINNISHEDKCDIYEIIIKYIQSSVYKIRTKIMKILNKVLNKKDYKQADFFIKNKILYYIKQAIDPSVTYCTDEKLILMSLNVINSLLALGDSMAILNGVNTVLIEFENIGGKEMLDNLLCNKSEVVFNYSSDLIDKYFK